MILDMWVTLSLYSTMFLGVGVILWAGTYVWSVAFNKMLIQLRIQRQFVDFIWEKFKKKRMEGK
jgi:hypothetical protein